MTINLPLTRRLRSGRPISLAARDWLARPAHVAWLYLLGVSLAEVLTAAVNPWVGVPLHIVVLFALLVHGALVSSARLSALLWGVALAPLIRVLSLSLPLADFPFISWYAIISVPIFAAVVVAARTIGYGPADLGLIPRARQIPLYLGLLLGGLLLGIGEYLILRPHPMSPELTLASAWLPALILAVSTGFEEELIFRGLLQRAATEVLGRTWGLLYVSLLFTVLHVGYLSLVDLVFVFAVGHLFALLARRNGTIVGVTLAHSGVNIGLFIVWPVLLPRLIPGL